MNGQTLSLEVVLLTDELNRLMIQASVDYGIPAKTEIHGHRLFHGKENWK